MKTFVRMVIAVVVMGIVLAILRAVLREAGVSEYNQGYWCGSAMVTMAALVFMKPAWVNRPNKKQEEQNDSMA